MPKGGAVPLWDPSGERRPRRGNSRNGARDRSVKTGGTPAPVPHQAREGGRKERKPIYSTKQSWWKALTEGAWPGGKSQLTSMAARVTWKNPPKKHMTRP